MMLTDLLRLYERIAATSATSDSLRIVYEFSEGDQLDVLLSAFRDQVRVTQTRIQSVLRLEITHDQLWSFPFWVPASDLPSELAAWADAYAAGAWPDDLPAPAQTGNAALDEAVTDVMAVLRAYLDRARSLAPDRPSLWPSGFDPLPADAEVVRSSDAENWLPPRLLALHTEVARAAKDQSHGAGVADRLRDWLDNLDWRQVEAEVVFEAVETVLALPIWGKRHEFYSAWLVTEFDKALPDRLTFRVHDGVLAFPFRATPVADMDSIAGPTELWAELRSPYHKPIGASRKNGIQPDYRFLAGRDTQRDTLLAVEAKQYLRPAAKNPGQALADYSGGLPKAVVILAAYGPVSPSAITYVPKSRRHRTHVHGYVHPGAAGSSSFRQEVTAALPPPKPKLTAPQATLELSWNPEVPDLDLHAYIATGDGEEHVYHAQKVSEHVELVEDVLDGREPERMIVRQGRDGSHPPVHVEVQVYTSDAVLAGAHPSLSVPTDRGPIRVRLPASAPATARTWVALSIDADGTIDLHHDFVQRDEGVNQDV
ncbi:hypothetical protein [Micromonospora aurantiaca]|uniref:hypothetical protein n=1 Tax=Micromonospora aurantiaca (nom. illeg.) TaxID=47850 RepID=UPI00119C975C|nr:hypothetical protein [Micromonospora aurantiaca]UFN96800.1 hypothetical protein LF814_11990 [Micromonospora aurantiaca]